MLNQDECLQTLFHQVGLSHLAYKVVTFMDIQTLQNLLNFKKQKIDRQVQKSRRYRNSANKTTSHMNNLVRTYIFLKQYLNKNDRSMYYSFYEEEQFVKVQAQLIQQITMADTKQGDNCCLYFQYLKHMQAIFDKMSEESLLDDTEIQEIKRIFVEPSIPIPKIKRQNQGMYAGSPFQLFLVSLRFPHHQDDFTLFQNLKQQIEQQQQNYLKRFFEIQKQKNVDPLRFQNVHFVRYTSYEINRENYSQLTLENHALHNLIIYLFTLTQIFIESIAKYLEQITDPLYRFVELMARYSAFRNFVIEIQDNIGFLFEIYDNLYHDTIRDSISNKPKFCFWRPAMTKWYLKINRIHQQSNQVYFMLLTNIRQNQLHQIFEKYPGTKKYQIYIKNILYEGQFMMNLKQKIYENKMSQNSTHPQFQQYNFNQLSLISNNKQYIKTQSIIKNFFEENHQLYDMLTSQYVEYIIDLSVNQETVHWCGHSKHHLQKPYDSFHQDFLNYNHDFCQHLNHSIKITNEQKRHKLLNLIFQEEINLLQQKNVKPLTLKDIVQEINEKYFLKNDSQNDSHQIHRINIDFTFEDQNLKYYNDKAKILQQINQGDKCFFSIPPLLSPQQILIKSIDTNDSDNQSNQNEHDSSYQYVSDNQDETKSQHFPSDQSIIEQKPSNNYISEQRQKQAQKQQQKYKQKYKQKCQQKCQQKYEQTQKQKQNQVQKKNQLLKIVQLTKQSQFDVQQKFLQQQCSRLKQSLDSTQPASQVTQDSKQTPPSSSFTHSKQNKFLKQTKSEYKQFKQFLYQNYIG